MGKVGLESRPNLLLKLKARDGVKGLQTGQRAAESSSFAIDGLCRASARCRLPDSERRSGNGVCCQACCIAFLLPPSQRFIGRCVSRLAAFLSSMLTFNNRAVSPPTVQRGR